MSFTEGTQLGVYEITGQIGAGGMGEVYRATDTKLGREVAIKTLPAELASDKDRLARFEREAKLLAALNHPHIASVYSLDEHEGTLYLAMELVEGQTLEEKLKPGALPVEDALRLALQIAEALEAAHGKGVVHRDLKPANVMVSAEGQVKVLDFGLAKAFSDDPSESIASQSPALSVAMTQQGLVLGTAAYMSPEQASGQPTDQRADIWAFGVVLYEMLTGLPLFSGESVPHILADVLKTEPDWDRLPANLHPRLQLSLERCLTKRPRNRYHSIADARVDIQNVLNDPNGSVVQVTVPASEHAQSLWYRVLMPIAVAVVVGGAVGFGVLFAMQKEAEPVWLSIVHPSRDSIGNVLDSDVVFSRDGRLIVYIVDDGSGDVGRGRLWVRHLNRLEPQLLAEDARAPFLSPDGEWLGFVEGSSGDFMKVATTGGPALRITSNASGPRGASWGPNDQVIFATGDPGVGLSRVSGGGGEADILTTPNSESGETNHIFPEFLPEGRGVLFTITNVQGIDNAQIAVLDLETLDYRVVIPGGSHGRYMLSGHIVYGVQGTLRAVPFDSESLEVGGTPVPVLENVITKSGGAASFSVSDNGTLVYVAGEASTAVDRSLVWVDRTGAEEDIGMQPSGYSYPRLSHDGSRLAVDEANQEGDIRVWSFATRNFVRLTTEEGSELYPVWTSSDDRIAFAQQTTDIIQWKASNNTGQVTDLATELGNGAQTATPYFFTSDDQALVFREQAHPETGDNIAMVRISENPELTFLLAGEFIERNAELSPDGNWIAYQSDESGQFEVYVRPFPSVDDGLWTISTDGGTKPKWSADGEELFYIEPGGPNHMMRVEVQTGETFAHGSPSQLLEWPYYSAEEGRAYDLSPDGQRFIALKFADDNDDGDRPPPQINVVQNWFEVLRRLAPTD